MTENCVFKFKYKTECNPEISCSHNIGTARIHSIINASKTYGDNLHIELERRLAENENVTIYFHRNCVSRYTSKSNLKANTNSEHDAPPGKKLRRSYKPFDFIQQYIYCGEVCDINKDAKNPGRCRPAYMCRSTHSEYDAKPYKQFILDICDSRRDRWADDVRVRVEGAVIDLHAVEARYHRDCFSRFRQNRTCKYDDECSTASEQEKTDEGLQHVVHILLHDKSHIWNSVELFHEYIQHAGMEQTRSCFIIKLHYHCQGDLVIMSCPGYASIIAFRGNAAAALKIVKDDEDDGIQQSISKVAKQIVQEIKAITCDKSSYKREEALVIADDTDIFVLLVHFCYRGNILCNVKMASPSHGRAVVDINATVETHRCIMPDLLAAHGLTGCDTMASYYGIGKGSALKVLKSSFCSLSHIGDPEIPLSEVISQATMFMLACYGQSICLTVTEARQKAWSSKVSRSVACAPKLSTLPPTNEAFSENVARAHLQVAVWKGTLESDPPALDPVQYGWCVLPMHKSLIPVTIPNDIQPAPGELLKLIKCSCTSSLPCKSQKCGCQCSNLPCTVFCACEGGPTCSNERTKQVQEIDEDTD